MSWKLGCGLADPTEPSQGLGVAQGKGTDHQPRAGPSWLPSLLQLSIHIILHSYLLSKYMQVLKYLDGHQPIAFLNVERELGTLRRVIFEDKKHRLPLSARTPPGSGLL